MIKSFKNFLKEDGMGGGTSSAAPVAVDGGVAGTSGQPPVTVKQQNKYKKSKIGLIKQIPPL